MRRLHSRPGPRRAAALLAAALLATMAAGASAAPATPFGPVLAVSPADGFFLAPDVAVDTAGNAVVVWYGEAAGQATPDVEVYARRFGPSGAALGPAFRVNAASAGQQRRPAVAFAPTGEFVVAWDTGTATVWARRFAADGAPLTGDIRVSQSAATHRDADVAVAADGTFLVAWQLSGPGGEDDVAVRRFDRDGTPLGAERIPYDPAGEADEQLNPALAALPAGATALVWEELRAASTAVLLQRLEASGAPAGPPQLVAESSAAELRDPAVAAGPDGAVVVAWATFPEVTAEPAARTYSVVARAYDAAGAARGPAVAVAPPGGDERFFPTVAVAADGTAVVAWVDATPALGAPVGVAARTLDAAGQPGGELFYPRPPAEGETAASSVAAAIGPAAPGDLWVAWAQRPAGAGDAVSAVALRRHVDQISTLALPLLRR